MSLPTWQDFGLKLCAALDLDPAGIRAIEVRVAIDEIVSVRIDRTVDVTDMRSKAREFAGAFETFKLVPLTSKEPKA